MASKRASIILTAVLCLAMGVTSFSACSTKTDTESSVQEVADPSSDESSDVSSDDISVQSSDSSESSVESSMDLETSQKLADKNEQIMLANTEYSERYLKFLEKLRTDSYSISYSIEDSELNKYDYKIVHDSNGNWYYKCTETIGDNSPLTYEYFEKNAMGYFYDEVLQVCVVISDTSETYEDLLPVKTGIKFKEKSKGKFSNICKRLFKNF